jgi:hypothetical protein
MSEISNDEIKETTPPETENNNEWEDADVSDNEISDNSDDSEVRETNDSETSDNNSSWENADVAETPDTNNEGGAEVQEPAETPDKESIRGKLHDIREDNPGEATGSDFRPDGQGPITRTR